MQHGGLRLKDSVDRRPLLSIVCATLNAADNFSGLIETINKHKSDLIELLVIDGGSTDDTVRILIENETTIDYWISEPDTGIYDAINKALKYVKGEWINFLGADDRPGPDFNKMLAVLKDPSTIYYGNVIFYGKEFLKVYDDYYLTKLNICHQAIFYPKSVFEKYRYNLKYKVYADYELNLKCWSDNDFKFSHVDYLVVSFSEGGYSSYTKDLPFENDKDKLFKRYLKGLSYYRYLNRTLGCWGMIKQLISNTLSN